MENIRKKAIRAAVNEPDLNHTELLMTQSQQVQLETLQHMRAEGKSWEEIRAALCENDGVARLCHVHESELELLVQARAYELLTNLGDELIDRAKETKQETPDFESNYLYVGILKGLQEAIGLIELKKIELEGGNTDGITS